MSQSTTPNASEPRLCKMGCGFFGSNATEDCCSKCFLEKQKKLGCQVIQPKPTPTPVVLSPPVEEALEAEPMEVEETPIVAEPEPAPVLKKKGKKTSYKAMMAAMTTSDAPRDIEKEKEAIRKTTGGGAFSKIEKI